MNCVLSSWISSMIRAGCADALSMNRNYESRLWISDLTTGDSIIVIFQKGMIIGGDSWSFYKTEKISNDHARKIEICFSIYFWIQDAMLLPQPSSKGNSSFFYSYSRKRPMFGRKWPRSFFGRFRPINAPALGQSPAAFGQTSAGFDFLYRPLSALLGFMAPYRSRESDRGYCPFPYFEW